ncbi:unnamed protein product [Vitrella brassicaformis CCMP3155]|uniref:Uncharacterized protein n=2 Tax=Vitrella brassicaformis TaxID=1169539 RepID=A0A0G4GPZ5_VITBC|nr:unnamed protein product [Vitrella brassicaformis CCMP3155]|eukprot:CEM32438.1 unnamed protein product [Vitrella brassicaformis CCMP3155]
MNDQFTALPHSVKRRVREDRATYSKYISGIRDVSPTAAAAAAAASPPAAAPAAAPKQRRRQRQRTHAAAAAAAWDEDLIEEESIRPAGMETDDRFQSDAEERLSSIKSSEEGDVHDWDQFPSDQEADSPFPTPRSLKDMNIPARDVSPPAAAAAAAATSAGPLVQVKTEDELDPLMAAEEDVGEDNDDALELEAEMSDDQDAEGRPGAESPESANKKQIGPKHKDVNNDEPWTLIRRVHYDQDESHTAHVQVEMLEKMKGKKGGKKWRQLRITTSVGSALVGPEESITEYAASRDESGNRRRNKMADAAVEVLLWINGLAGRFRPKGWSYGGTSSKLQSMQNNLTRLLSLFFVFNWPIGILRGVLSGVWQLFLDRVRQQGEDARPVGSLRNALLDVVKGFAERYCRVSESLYRSLQLKLHIGWQRLQLITNLLINDILPGRTRWSRSKKKPRILPSKKAIQTERHDYMPSLEEVDLFDLLRPGGALGYACDPRKANEHFSST